MTANGLFCLVHIPETFQLTRTYVPVTQVDGSQLWRALHPESQGIVELIEKCGPYRRVIYKKAGATLEEEIRDSTGAYEEDLDASQLTQANLNLIVALDIYAEWGEEMIPASLNGKVAGLMCVRAGFPPRGDEADAELRALKCETWLRSCEAPSDLPLVSFCIVEDFSRHRLHWLEEARSRNQRVYPFGLRYFMRRPMSTTEQEEFMMSLRQWWASVNLENVDSPFDRHFRLLPARRSENSSSLENWGYIYFFSQPAAAEMLSKSCADVSCPIRCDQPNFDL